MKRSFIAIAALAALAACAPRETPAEPTDATPAGEPTAAVHPAAAFKTIDINVPNVVLINDETTNCQYFATTGVSGVSNVQPRVASSDGRPQCGPTPATLFVPSEPYTVAITGVDGVFILVDQVTHCQYLLTTIGDGGNASLRPRLNADGTVRCVRV